MPPSRSFVVRLDPEDRALLDATAKAQRFDRSTVLRLALRAYAEAQGVEQPKAPQGSRHARRRRS